MPINQVISAVERELQHYPGVAMKQEERGKHQRLLFSRNGSSRFLTVPKSASDWRASHNAVRDFRKTMEELGVERLGPSEAPHLPKRTGKRAKVASFALNEKLLVFHVPKDSKIIKQFRRHDARPMSQWEIYFKSSPDLEAPPMVALKRTALPAGVLRKIGISGGFEPAPGSWRITISRASFPMLDSIDRLQTVPLTLYEQNDSELVFKLPPGVLPTSFRKPDETPPFVTPDDRAPEPAMPVERREAPQAAPAPVVEVDRNLTLQFPKQSVSVEAAIAVLNKAKRRLGNNLRFTIGEEGYLTAVHRIGH